MLEIYETMNKKHTPGPVFAHPDLAGQSWFGQVPKKKNHNIMILERS